MKSGNIINIVFKSIKIYIMNLHKFFLYMAFPVFGQLLGLVLIFLPTMYMHKILPNLAAKYSFFTEPSKVLAVVLLMILPGLVLLISAFWKYLVAYVALNSMTHSALTTGKIYDFPAHNGVVNNHIWKFILLWLVVSIFSLFAMTPFLIIPAIIFFIFFILIFQVFTFEPELNVVNYFSKSFKLIKGNYLKTLSVVALLFLITWGLCNLIEFGLSKIVDNKNFLIELAQMFVSTDLIVTFNASLPPVVKITSQLISHILFSLLVGFVVMGLTLPLRSIAWTLWYKKLNSGNFVKTQVKKKGKKQLDPEILRRANLKDDEEV